MAVPFFGIYAVTKFSAKFTSLGYFFLHCSSSLEPHIAPCHSPHKPILFTASLWACTDIYKLWSTMQLYGFIDPFFSSWKWHFLSIWLARKPKVTKIEVIWPFLIVSLWGIGTASFASYLNFVVCLAVFRLSDCVSAFHYPLTPLHPHSIFG